MAYGFYFDMTACTGCLACKAACMDLKGALCRRVLTLEGGAYPNPRVYHLSIACCQCEAPACRAACETGAIEKDAAGLVHIDPGACVGCGACMDACPYGAIRMRSGVALKCDPSKEEVPACVAACPMRALDWGDLDALQARHGAALPLPGPEGTGPNLLIRPKPWALEGTYREREL